MRLPRSMGGGAIDSCERVEGRRDPQHTKSLGTFVQAQIREVHVASLFFIEHSAATCSTPGQQRYDFWNTHETPHHGGIKCPHVEYGNDRKEGDQGDFVLNRSIRSLKISSLCGKQRIFILEGI